MLVTNFKIKYILYRLVCALYQLNDVAKVHPVRERSLRALNDTVDYIDRNMAEAVGFETQKEITIFALSQVKVEGHYLEFGVFSGGTISFISKRIAPKIIHGFDSFEGLPEDWGGFQYGKGTFSLLGKRPKVPKNVALHSGWFQDSLPIWICAFEGRAAFIHIDCDIYTSTKTIFDLLYCRFQVGTIILFDEYFNYANWRNHEFKAFQEFVDSKKIKYSYLAYARQQVAVRIDSL